MNGPMDKTPAAGQAGAPEDGATFPYWELLFREVIGIQVLAVVLIWIALRWNAPLEQLADPTHTPNPAKAPWYFTGLQELLHYFPPFVAGIILPGLIVLALIVIPFFNVNITGESLWTRNKTQRLLSWESSWLDLRLCSSISRLGTRCCRYGLLEHSCSWLL